MCEVFISSRITQQKMEHKCCSHPTIVADELCEFCANTETTQARGLRPVFCPVFFVDCSAANSSALLYVAALLLLHPPCNGSILIL